MISTRGSLPENEYQEQASGTNITPAKWGLAAALAGLIVAVGAGIYLSKPVRFVVDEEAMLQKEHETGFILIQGAAEKHLLLAGSFGKSISSGRILKLPRDSATRGSWMHIPPKSRRSPKTSATTLQNIRI